MNDLYLAADSGGTKTDWLVFDSAGTLLFRTQSPGIARLQSGTLSADDFIRDTSALSQFTVKSVCMSLGGPNTDEVQSLLKLRFPTSEVRVEREGNGEMILTAAKCFGCSAAVLCGTGSTAMGIVNGRMKYAGGWGPVYGDDGAGGGVGFVALKTMLRAVDGMADAGRLPELFTPLSDGQDITSFAGRMEFKRRANAMTRADLAALAPKIERLASEGDAVANAILDHAAEDNALLAAAVTTPDVPSGVFGCGGFFRIGESFTSACETHLARLRPKAHWFFAPADFAVILAVVVRMMQLEKLPVRDDMLFKLMNDYTKLQRN